MNEEDKAELFSAFADEDCDFFPIGDLFKLSVNLVTPAGGIKDGAVALAGFDMVFTSGRIRGGGGGGGATGGLLLEGGIALLLTVAVLCPGAEEIVAPRFFSWTVEMEACEVEIGSGSMEFTSKTHSITAQLTS